ncbi:MAG: cobalamin-dependent protein [Candidatus Omnitrophica bacterium]|nr:cobalamin-dependent protein [Candidatus Omnitrophota bacterium]
MNILFIDPSSPKGLVTEQALGRKLPTPNMGIVYIATYVKLKTGANVKILDIPTYNLSHGDVEKAVKDLRPAIVGISSKTFNILSAYKIAACVKKVCPETITLVGGAHSTALPEYTLRECVDIDAAVIREGEDTIVELCQRIRHGCRATDDLFVNLKGVAWRNKSGLIIRNDERALIKDLDSLPFPDLSLVCYKKYARVYNPSKYNFQHVYPIFASRGCPFRCTFCMPLHTRKHRVRAIENILDEIDLLNKEHGAQRIYFEDSLFCSKKEWFARFCDEYIKRGLHKKVQWGFETRIDTADPEMFKHAKKAGCIYTFFGVESGSEEVLEKANKGYAKDAIIEKVHSAKCAGISHVNISIIFGLPYENKNTLEETMKLIARLPCDNASINILDAYPATDVFKMADQGEGGLRWIEGKRMNWEAYSREEPMLEVNDLDAGYLIAARKRAYTIVAKKSRKDKLRLNMKRLAYVVELAKTNRPKLVKNVIDTLKGKK